MRLGHLALLCGGLWTVAAAADEASLADRAYRILEQRCSRCHGGAARQAGLDVLSREALVEERGDIGSRFAFIVPGKPDESQLLDAVAGGADSYMPQDGSPEAEAMTDAEKALLTEWVAAGAEFPERTVRQFLTEKAVLAAVRAHLLETRADDRRFLRFFTFTHLHNNPRVTARDLRLYRAALAKVLNSLSQKRDIVVPQPLEGSDEAVYVVDLRALGWEEGDKWQSVLDEYPYGLKHDFVTDEEFSELSKDVRQFSGADLAYLRADWFVVTATRPPLYHDLLDIPDTLGELEESLQLDVEKNILDGRVARSGYAKSGVSKQNRLIERHTSPATPYFWVSYDFKPKRPKGDLTRFPLGPEFEGNPFRHQAFEHDGGEIIWSLPNGMQAYMLVDAEGGRIDSGPVDVVFDRSAVLGTPEIVNGISCMYCHREGMITEFRDEIRGANAVGGDPLVKVKQIYPPHEEMQNLVRRDRDLFVRALDEVTARYLLAEGDPGSVTLMPEPVGKVAEMYSRDLKAHEVALELGIERLEDLQAMIRTNRNLLRFGLGALAQNPPATLKREKWETRDGTSLMQDVASQLRLGTPFIP